MDWAANLAAASSVKNMADGMLSIIKAPFHVFPDILFHYFGAMGFQKAAERLEKNVGFIPEPTLLNQQTHLLMEEGW
jgi:hypothetical protein